MVWDSKRAKVNTSLRELESRCKLIRKEPGAHGVGGFSDVYQGICSVDSLGEVRVAMKKLRMNLKSVDVARVSL